MKNEICKCGLNIQHKKNNQILVYFSIFHYIYDQIFMIYDFFKINKYEVLVPCAVITIVCNAIYLLHHYVILWEVYDRLSDLVSKWRMPIENLNIKFAKVTPKHFQQTLSAWGDA